METQNLQVGANGEYTVLLGSTRNDGIPAEAFAAGERWLGVHVQGVQGEAERPRVLIASVPYSLKAVDAETLGGLPASAFALAGPAAHGEMRESPAGSGKPAQATADVTPNLTGTGTTNYIPLWTSTTNIGNSHLYQTAAGSVGLGTTTPAAKLEAITTTATGTGVPGSATPATGANFGVSGKTASSAGTGVLGSATATTGNAYGVSGASASSTGAGVQGVATATTGVNTGVIGVTASSTGRRDRPGHCVQRRGLWRLWQHGEPKRNIGVRHRHHRLRCGGRHLRSCGIRGVRRQRRHHRQRLWNVWHVREPHAIRGVRRQHSDYRPRIRRI